MTKQSKAKSTIRKVLAFTLALVMVLGGVISNPVSVEAGQTFSDVPAEKVNYRHNGGHDYEVQDPDWVHVYCLDPAKSYTDKGGNMNIRWKMDLKAYPGIFDAKWVEDINASHRPNSSHINRLVAILWKAQQMNASVAETQDAVWYFATQGSDDNYTGNTSKYNNYIVKAAGDSNWETPSEYNLYFYGGDTEATSGLFKSPIPVNTIQNMVRLETDESGNPPEKPAEPNWEISTTVTLPDYNLESTTDTHATIYLEEGQTQIEGLHILDKIQYSGLPAGVEFWTMMRVMQLNDDGTSNPPENLIDYQLDESGAKVLDDDGNPIIVADHSYRSIGGGPGSEDGMPLNEEYWIGQENYIVDSSGSGEWAKDSSTGTWKTLGEGTYYIVMSVYDSSTGTSMTIDGKGDNRETFEIKSKTPSITNTTAKLGTGDKQSVATDEKEAYYELTDGEQNVALTDTVEFKGLDESKTYKIKATVKKGDSKVEEKTSDEITNKKEGSIDISFNNVGEGTYNIVAELICDGEVVATHNGDLDDTSERAVVKETVKTTVKKNWLNSDGTTTWPESIKSVTFTVKYGEETEDIVLTETESEKSTKNFVKVDGATWTVTEQAVVGYKTGGTEGTAEKGFSITNTQFDGDTIEIELEATKSYVDDEGNPMELKGGEFTFGFFWSNGNKRGEASNDADGKVGPVVVDSKDDEEYYLGYYVQEIVPDGAVQTEENTWVKDGIIYDTTKHSVVVDVTKDDDNKLSFQIRGDAKIAIINKYHEPTPINIQFIAKKALAGKTEDVVVPIIDDVKNAFTFTLTGDEDQNQEKNNQEGGLVTFDPIALKEAKEYRFTISEKAGDNELIEYSKDTRKITVVTKQNDEGNIYVDSAKLLDGTAINISEPVGGVVTLTLPDGKELTNTYKNAPLPTVATSAKAASGNELKAEANQSITDTIELTNLKKGVEYTITGKLMIKEDNAEVKTYSATPVTFTADADGAVSKTMDFTGIDASDLAGKSLVVFETLSWTSEIHGKNNKSVEHNDLDDEAQTVTVETPTTPNEETPTVPTVATTAKAASGNELKAEANQGITDTIELTNLKKGVEYTITGKLMIKEDNAEVTTYSATPVTFTADADGAATKTMEFTGIDASELGGKSLVVYETLSWTGDVHGTTKEVKHEDINDTKQTVTIPDTPGDEPETPDNPDNPTPENPDNPDNPTPNEPTYPGTDSPGVTSRTISVNKVWDDENNAEGHRPGSVTVNLLANGVATGKTVTLSAANSWRASFTELDTVDENGKAIVYTISEDAVPYYVAFYSASGSDYTVRNYNRPWIPEMPSTPGEVGGFTLQKTVGGNAPKDYAYEIQVKLTDPNGTVYTSTVSLKPTDAPYRFDYLLSGTRVEITEITKGFTTTYTVNGYKTPNFTIESGGSYTAVVNNYTDDAWPPNTPGNGVPRTGDASDMAGWIMLLALGAALTVATLQRRSR